MALKKTRSCHMISNVAGSFWDLNSISRAFEVIFSYFSILGFLMNFRDFRVFVFRYRPQKRNSEIKKNVYFWFYKGQMDMNLFFDHYFNFLSAKTQINKKVNLINLDGLEVILKENYLVPDWEYDWIILRLIWFEEHLNSFWCYILIFQYYGCFLEFFMIFEFSVLGVRLKTKTQKSQKILFFFSFFFSNFIKVTFALVFLY